MKRRIEIEELYPEYVLMPPAGDSDFEIPENLVIRYDKAVKAFYTVQNELRDIYEGAAAR